MKKLLFSLLFSYLFGCSFSVLPVWSPMEKLILFNDPTITIFDNENCPSSLYNATLDNEIIIVETRPYTGKRMYTGLKLYILEQLAERHVYSGMTGEYISKNTGWQIKKEYWSNVLLLDCEEFQCKAVPKKNKWLLELSTEIGEKGSLKRALFQALEVGVLACPLYEYIEELKKRCEHVERKNSLKLLEGTKIKYDGKKSETKLRILLEFANAQEFDDLLEKYSPEKKRYTKLDGVNKCLLSRIFGENVFKKSESDEENE